MRSQLRTIQQAGRACVSGTWAVCRSVSARLALLRLAATAIWRRNILQLYYLADATITPAPHGQPRAVLAGPSPAFISAPRQPYSVPVIVAASCGQYRAGGAGVPSRCGTMPCPRRAGRGDRDRRLVALTFTRPGVSLRPLPRQNLAPHRAGRRKSRSGPRARDPAPVPQASRASPRAED